MRLLIRSWGYSVPLLQNSYFPFLENMRYWYAAKLISLNSPNHTLLDSCLENLLAIPFVQFLTREEVIYQVSI